LISINNVIDFISIMFFVDSISIYFLLVVYKGINFQKGIYLMSFGVYPKNIFEKVLNLMALVHVAWFSLYLDHLGANKFVLVLIIS
ncbi:hypothetical protein ACJX0J_008880, partial [Zea mays]